MYWSDEALNQEIYDLTRKGLYSNDDETVTSVLWKFEDIVQTKGYGLPVQKAFLLWESKKISAKRLVLFFENCYKWANDYEGETSLNLKDEVARWAFHFLWRLARSDR